MIVSVAGKAPASLAMVRLSELVILEMVEQVVQVEQVMLTGLTGLAAYAAELEHESIVGFAFGLLLAIVPATGTHRKS